jgi:uncharacterized protein (TIGR00661 family)
MKKENFNNHTGSPRVLIAPLDWGLGHATRCIPIIYELLANGCEVIVAAEKRTKSLLIKEFPELVFLSLEGYEIQYSHTSSLLPLKFFMQFPKLVLSIYKEHQWLKKAIKKYKVDAVISDNRFGFYNVAVPCIYITHQLFIKTSNDFTEKIAQKIHYWFIKKYSYCWVPDFEEEINIAGELSHLQKKQLEIIYLGCLSRFKKRPLVEKKYKLAIILSGPEPQRTIFENLLLQQLKAYKESTLFVRGLPGDISIKQNNQANINITNHLPSEELGIAIQQSDLVISRSGYTTIMDLIKLQQKAIFIPTPGQTEQEYLAKHLSFQKMFLYFNQQYFNLIEAIDEAENFIFNPACFDMEQYKSVVYKFVQSLKK